MARESQLSVRARLTVIFVIAIAVVLTFTGIALVNLVHRSLLSQASDQIDAVMEQTQMRFASAPTAQKHMVVLATQGDVVVQVTNIADTKVWAASSAISSAPVLARSIVDFQAGSGLGVKFIHNATNDPTLAELSSGQVATITTKRGQGLIFGFVYGGPIEHSVKVLLASLLISFPLLLLDVGWSDLARYRTGPRAGRGDSSTGRRNRGPRPHPARSADRRRRRDRAAGAHGERDAGSPGVSVAVRAGVRLQREPRTAKSPDHAARDDRARDRGPRQRQLARRRRRRHARRAPTRRHHRRPLLARSPRRGPRGRRERRSRLRRPALRRGDPRSLAERLAASTRRWSRRRASWATRPCSSA